MTEQEKNEIVDAVIQKLFNKVELPVEIMEGASLPFYAHPGDAGMDLRANADIDIAPMQTVIIPTGFKAAIPEGCEIAIRPRSGLNAKTPLRVAYGTIDAGYRGEFGVVMTNYSPENYKDIDCTIEDKHKFGTYHIKKGDRIAQIVMGRFCEMDLKQVEDITTIEGNRGGGFGSSGVK